MSNPRDTTPIKVIDSMRWLRSRVEDLVEQKQYSQAIEYLLRLQAGTAEPEERLYCLTSLGFVYLLSDRIEDARAALLEARAQAPAEPQIAYALGHCASLLGERWPAVLYFLEAVHQAGDVFDEAEFMRSCAISLQRLGFTERAHSMLLGALDRELGNPWILDAMARLYEQEGKWMETLDILEALIEAINDADIIEPTMDSEPSASQLLRNALLGAPADSDALRERARTINARLRNKIDLVYDEHDRELLEHTGLTPLNFPPAMHMMVEALGRRERCHQLLETAQSVWARAHHERFDVILTPYTLAASIHALVERLHWRVATPLPQLCAMYRVDTEKVEAASRIIAEHFAISYLPRENVYPGLDATQGRRLENIQRALLYDVDVATLESRVVMLGV